MSKQMKHFTTLPMWLKKAARENVDTLQLVDPSHALPLQHAEECICALESRFSQLPEKQTFTLMTVEAFNDLVNRSVHPHAFESAFYSEIVEMALMLNRLGLQRAMSLTTAFVRSANTHDYYSIAFIGRGLLELGVVVADSIRHALALIDEIASIPKTHRLVVRDEVGRKRIQDVEKNLYNALFGSRIGQGDIGDSAKTSIWDRDWGEYAWSETTSKNILAHFQGRAKRIKNGAGISAMRVYTVLCDVVHPSLLGYHMIVRPGKEETNKKTYRMNKYEFNKEISNVVAAASVFAAAHGCGLLCEVSEKLTQSAPVALRRIQEYVHEPISSIDST
jgi:hypothetical protein